VAAAAGCPDQTAACLRNLPVGTLLSSFPSFAIPGVVDGKVLTQSIGTALATGRFAHVPVLNGVNHDEELLFVILTTPVSGGTFVQLTAAVTDANYQQTIESTLGVSAARAAAIAVEYPTSAYGGSAPIAFSVVMSDSNFACPALQVDRWTSARASTFTYEFDDDAASPRFPVATHGSELPLLFGLPDAPNQTPLTPDEQALSATMQAAWASFAANGDPSTPALPWPSFNRAENGLSLRTPQPVVDSQFAARHHCSFWDEG